jgi:Uri superfamily endonuclease
LPASPVQIASAAVQIDSLVVVSILCAVEPILGFELSETMVRAGGYVSVDSALSHLLPRIEKHWIKRKE